MLTLKKLLDENNISSARFIKRFKEITAENMSKASLSLFLKDGRELKKIPDFKAKIAKTYNSLVKDNKSIKELFEIEQQEENMLESINLTYDELKYFGLSRDPFLPFITKESEIVMLDSHHYALEMMRAARETGQFTVITSEVGGGKTTVLGKFEAETKSLSDCIIVKVRTRDMDRCTTKDILAACVFDLSDDKPKRGAESLSRQVETLLKKHHDAGKRIILIIDEAQDLHTHTLKYLKRLWELRDGLTPLIGIILIGQIELATRLYSDNNLAVREVTARTIHAPLEPINESLKEYITGKVKCVKGDASKLITDDAINELANILSIKDANGKVINKAYPLEVNNRIKRLMKQAYEQGVKVINKDFIQECL